MKKRFTRTKIVIFAIAILLLGMIACNKGCITRPHPTSLVRGYVYDSLSNMPIGSAFVSIDTVIDSDSLYIFDYTDTMGFYNIVMAGGGQDLPISAFKEDYYPKTIQFSVVATETVRVDFYLKPDSL
jgi:hypothetical protein